MKMIILWTPKKLLIVARNTGLLNLFVRLLYGSFVRLFILSKNVHVKQHSADRRIHWQQKTFPLIVSNRAPAVFLWSVYATLFQILRTIPFHQLDVRLLSVEYVHGRAGKRSYVQFMTQQGYQLHKDIHFHDQPMTLFVDDFIFVKKTFTDRWFDNRQ